MIDVHALIIYSEKIEFDHSIACNNFFLYLKKITLIDMHMGSFADFHRKQLPRRRSFALCYIEFQSATQGIVLFLF